MLSQVQFQLQEHTAVLLTAGAGLERSQIQIVDQEALTKIAHYM